MTIIRKFWTNNLKGFGLIEVMIAGSIVAITFMAVAAFLIFSRGINFQIQRNTEAISLAEEGMEAVRSMRDESWASNIANKTASTIYYPVIFGGKWTLTTNNPGVINGLYVRTVTFSNVNRDGSDNIVASGGINDPNTKYVQVNVSWTEDGRSKRVEVRGYITNFLNN